MGWLYSSSWKSQKDVEKHILGSIAEGYKCLDTSSRAGELYAAIQRPDGEVFILTILIRSSGGEFGYKDIEEDMGPLYYNCPERLLQLSTMQDATSVEWREKCRKKRADKLVQKRILREAVPGQIIKTSFGEVEFQRYLNESKTSFAAKKVATELVFRYSVSHIKID